MDGQAAHVADVGEMAEELESFDESPPGFRSSTDPEGHDRSSPVGQVAQLPLVPRARLEAGVADPGHLVTGLEPLGHRSGVLDVAFHPEAEGLQPLEKQERVERSNGGADVPEVLQTGLQNVPGGEQGLGELREDQAVIAGIRLGEVRETAAALVVEGASIDDDA